MPGVLSSVCQRAVVRARFFKMYKHRGPKTGKDDRLGFYYQHNSKFWGLGCVDTEQGLGCADPK